MDYLYVFVYGHHMPKKMPCVSERRALQCFIQLSESLRLLLSPSPPIGLEQAIRSDQWPIPKDKQASGQQHRGKADQRIVRLSGDPQLCHQDFAGSDHQLAPELLVGRDPVDRLYKRVLFCHVLQLPPIYVWFFFRTTI